MKRNWIVLLSFAWLLIVLLVSVFGPAFSKLSPIQPVDTPLTPPSQHPPMGTDAFGRDLWVRMMYGSRTSPWTALLATAITVLVGGLVGLIAASVGGWIDQAILGVVNAALAIPRLLLAMLLVTGLGPSLSTVILAVGFGGAPGFTRLTRTIFLQIRERGYVQAAEALGASRTWNAIHHLLPNARDQILSLTTTHYAWAFMGTTTLTFLGMAGDPSIAEWGAMLDSGRLHLLEAPWVALWPGFAISFTILSIHVVGEWLGRRQEG
jgi:peptide/nickel transport system permease protein